MAEEDRQKLEAELESAKRVLRDALDFVNDDRNLTEEGIAEREVLRKDLEAIRQEHGLD